MRHEARDTAESEADRRFHPVRDYVVCAIKSAEEAQWISACIVRCVHFLATTARSVLPVVFVIDELPLSDHIGHGLDLGSFSTA